MSVTSAQILRKAADILQTNGRTTGEYYDSSHVAEDGPDPSQCPVCALGAIALAAGCDLADMSLWDPQDGNEDLAMDAARALADHLDIIGKRDDPNTLIDLIGNWNDRPTTTDAHVLAALNATADALEAQAAREALAARVQPVAGAQQDRADRSDLDGGR